MKGLLIIFILLSGCGGGEVRTYEDIDIYEADYIVTGQSNANRPNWSSFEKLTSSVVLKISRGGIDIDGLIADYKSMADKVGTPKAIIFIHGESDSINGTNPDYYVKRVERYRKMISDDVGIDLPMYISTVGYYEWRPELDASFDAIREAVKVEVETNPNWIIAYDDARYFRDWGLLEEVDGIHFKPAACELLIDSLVRVI